MRLALTGAAAALAAAAAVPAAAQPAPYVEELVVTGPVGPEGPSRLSQVVSFDDLDLTTPEGQHVLRLRVRDTAEVLCRALGEANAPGDALVPSCEDKAFRDARPRMVAAVRQAFARAQYAAY